MGEGQHTVKCILPPCLRHQSRRSGCFPAVALSSGLAWGILSMLQKIARE